MPRRHKDTDKQKALRHQGTLNPRPQDVRHPLFRDGDFFDPDDMIQVKYEMLRQVHVDNLSVSEAAHDFGLSRPSFYQASAGFERAGLSGRFRCEVLGGGDSGQYKSVKREPGLGRKSEQFADEVSLADHISIG
jgi:hypothetical protein